MENAIRVNFSYISKVLKSHFIVAISQLSYSYSLYFLFDLKNGLERRTFVWFRGFRGGLSFVHFCYDLPECCLNCGTFSSFGNTSNFVGVCGNSVKSHWQLHSILGEVNTSIRPVLLIIVFRFKHACLCFLVH